jgi:hypothetical protein
MSRSLPVCCGPILKVEFVILYKGGTTISLEKVRYAYPECEMFLIETVGGCGFNFLFAAFYLALNNSSTKLNPESS